MSVMHQIRSWYSMKVRFMEGDIYMSTEPETRKSLLCYLLVKVVATWTLWPGPGQKLAASRRTYPVAIRSSFTSSLCPDLLDLYHVSLNKPSVGSLHELSLYISFST